MIYRVEEKYDDNNAYDISMPRMKKTVTYKSANNNDIDNNDAKNSSYSDVTTIAIIMITLIMRVILIIPINSNTNYLQQQR